MWIVSTLMCAVLIGIDQWTKHLAVLYLSDGSVAKAVPGVFDFLYVENRGAAFGMLQDTRWFLVAITVALIAALVVFVLKNKSKSWLLFGAVALIVAGGIGNLIDRVWHGYVVDFIHLLFMDFPCFNVADMCVCIGAVLLAIYILISGDTKRSEEKDVGNL